MVLRQVFMFGGLTAVTTPRMMPQLMGLDHNNPSAIILNQVLFCARAFTPCRAAPCRAVPCHVSECACVLHGHM